MSILIDDFNEELAKNDFVYFATHCLIDARTGKPIQWSSAQIELMKRLVEYRKQEPKTSNKRFIRRRRSINLK